MITFLALLTFYTITPRISLYFEQDTLVKRLSHFVANAQYSLDICFHQYYNDTIIDSTLYAYARGVKIRVITEHDYINNAGTQRLVNAGIDVIDEGTGPNTTAHRMHNKFIIRDYRDTDTSNDYVWMGSYNATSYKHADNALTIQSHGLSSIFENEFTQMWGDTGDTHYAPGCRFGSNKQDVNTNHEVVVDNIPIFAYFSPYNRCKDLILQDINASPEEIDFCMFDFDIYEIYSTMTSEFQNGCQVWGVLEGDLTDNRNAYDYFTGHSVPVVYDNYYGGSLTFMHHKFMILNDSVTYTGSYNFTYKADTSNDESIFKIECPEIANDYKNEFIARYNETGNTYDIRENHGRYARAGAAVVNAKTLTGKWVYTVSGKKLRMHRGINNGIYFYPNKGKILKVIMLTK